MAEEAKQTNTQPDALTRNMVVWLLGTPDAVEGSLNDPHEREEQGLRFNEKWIYRSLAADPAGARSRIVYWHRYDFAGTVIGSGKDGTLQPDRELEQTMRSIKSRAAERGSVEPFEPGRNRPVPARYWVDNSNPAITPAGEYRPVSEFEGNPDLGGHIQGWVPRPK